MFVQCGYEEIRTNALYRRFIKKLMEEIEMTIKHNGKEITLTPEQEKSIIWRGQAQDGYERVKKGGVYFTDSDLEGTIFSGR